MADVGGIISYTSALATRMTGLRTRMTGLRTRMTGLRIRMTGLRMGYCLQVGVQGSADFWLGLHRTRSIGTRSEVVGNQGRGFW